MSNVLYVQNLEKQLAAAIAACKMKDNVISMVQDNYFLHEHHAQLSEEALAIQPDDSALKAWLGKPTDWKFTTSSGTHYTDDKRDWLDGYGIESVTPLYSPKELK